MKCLNCKGLGYIITVGEGPFFVTGKDTCPTCKGTGEVRFCRDWDMECEYPDLKCEDCVKYPPGKNYMKDVEGPNPDQIDGDLAPRQEEKKEV